MTNLTLLEFNNLNRFAQLFSKIHFEKIKQLFFKRTLIDTIKRPTFPSGSVSIADLPSVVITLKFSSINTKVGMPEGQRSKVKSQKSKVTNKNIFILDTD